MKILFTFENPLPSRQADAEVFLTTARYLAPLVSRSWLHVPLPRAEGSAAVAALAGMPVVRARAPLRPAALRHLCCALALVLRREFREADLVYTRNLWVAWVAILCGQRVAFDHYRPWSAQIPPLQPWIYRLLAHPRFLVNICHSDYTRGKHLALGLPADKLACVRNGFEPARLQARLPVGAAKQALGLDPARRTVVYTGRLNHRKGLALVVEAARLLPDHLFLLVGSSGEGPIEALAATVANIRVVGWQEPDALARHIFAADVLLIPPSWKPLAEFGSTVLPLKLFLYMASGRAILAGDADVREVLHHGTNAFLCRPDSPDALAVGLRTLARDSALAARLAVRALEDSRGHTWDARAHAIAGLLAARLQPSAARLQPATKGLQEAVAARPGWGRAQSGAWIRQSWRWLRHRPRPVLGAAAGVALVLRPAPGRRGGRARRGHGAHALSGSRRSGSPRVDSGPVDGPCPAITALDSRRQLGQGFNWLGGATVIAKAVDFATILAMLLLLTKQQVGVASIVVSVGMVVEALNGLGTGEALIQARDVTRLQLDTLFWYVLGASLAVGALCVLAAPWIAAAYGLAGMGGYLLAIAAKQPLVAAALIPLALMNRDLQYKRIAVVAVCATVASALTRLALGAAGAGAWALVAGYAASGLYTLVGAMLARPFRPRLRCRLASIRPLARFGVRAAAAGIAEQMFKNVDYLLIGWFYGAAPLAIYRVAFDIAMEPAMAVATLVNRTALPVLARVAAVRSQVAQILAWALARSAALVAPLTAGLMLAATPLTALLHDGAGNSYAAAATPLRLLAAAALLRVVAQPLVTVMIASGRPGGAARLSATMLVLLAAGIGLVAAVVPASAGTAAVAGVWLAIYPLLLAWGARYLLRDWDVAAADLARAFGLPGAGIAAMVLAVMAARSLIGPDARLQLALVVAATALLYAGLFLRGRRQGSK